MKSSWINVLLFFGSLILIFGLCKVADIVFGVISPHNDLIFDPNTSAVYKTTEFDCEVTINSLGFRGPAPLQTKSDAKRILLLGDSFTFGWGLNWDETWGAQAEKSLEHAGYNVDLFNLGKPGSNPQQYPAIAAAALPITKPDLVIVNILQGDDLFQMTSMRMIGKSNRTFSKPEPRLLQLSRKYFRLVFPNFGRVIFSGEMLSSKRNSFDISKDWQAQSRAIYDFFNNEEKSRFNAIDPQIQEMYYNGSLNPKLVYDAVMVSDRFQVHENIEDPKTKQVIASMARALLNIKQLAEQYNSDMIVCLVPYGPYVDPLSLESLRKMGYSVDDSLLSSTASADAVARAAEIAGIPFFSPLEKFRNLPPGTAYYQYDGHLTPEGAAAYAAFITHVLKNRLDKKTN